MWYAIVKALQSSKVFFFKCKGENEVVWWSNDSVLGERLTDTEVQDFVKDCVEPEDEDGFTPYVRKYSFLWLPSACSLFSGPDTKLRHATIFFM